MKKFLLTFLVMMLMVSVASAGWFDWLKGDGITGGATMKYDDTAYPSKVYKYTECEKIASGVKYSYLSAKSAPASSSTRLDFCNEDDKTLTNYYCKSKKVYYSTTTCSNGCEDVSLAEGTAQKCRVLSENDASDIDKMTCTDSDSGINPQSAGYLEGTDSAGIAYEKASASDVCINAHFLKEWICAAESNKPDSLIIPCQTACSNSACEPKPNTCTDSDAGGGELSDGKNYYKFGQIVVVDVYGKKAFSKDSCSQDKVTEWYCDPATNTAKYELHQCGADETCRKGQCEGRKCMDSDETEKNKGKDYYTQGTVTSYQPDGDVVYTDVCLGGENSRKNAVLEGVCQSKDGKTNEFTVIRHPCKYGCVNGACTKKAGTTDTEETDTSGDTRL